MKRIVEICRRSQQGATQPFLCCTEDGFSYWVKGRNIDDYSRCAEWMSARLGQAFGLPIPEVALLKVDSSMLDDPSCAEAVSVLGDGLAFGSRNVECSIEFESQFIKDVQIEMQRRIFLFDFILRNTDRTFVHRLGSSGNPNLLWADRRVFVIDHNNAFLTDDMFALGDFGRHVFVSALRDFDFTVELTRIREMLLNLWIAEVGTLPREWLADETILPRMKMVLETPLAQLQQRLATLQKGLVK